MDRLTLDTNVVQDHWRNDSRRAAIDTLVSLAEAGEVELAVTRYIRHGVPREPLATRINRLAQELRVSGPGGVFDESRPGDLDGLGSRQLSDFQAALGDWRPRRGKRLDRRDWLHLHAHFIQRRTAFLTWDRALREVGDRLATAGFAIRVTRPDDYLASRGE